MNIPAHLKYTATHEWIEILPDNRVRVGITDYAQSHMGDIVFVNLPEVGSTLTVGGALTDIESVKAVEDLFSPVEGTVAQVNGDLEDEPERVNRDPYAAWIAEIEVTGEGEWMDAQAYQALIQKAEG